MSNHDNWKELAADYRLTIDELAEKVRALEETVESEHARYAAEHELYEKARKEAAAERRMRSTLHKNLEAAYERLRRLDREAVPYQASEGAWECPECCCALVEDWEFCPSCGAALDWDAANEPNWYAEEGERFYREQQVSAPLGVVPL